jgi:hypothetical protein
MSYAKYLQDVMIMKSTTNMHNQCKHTYHTYNKYVGNKVYCKMRFFKACVQLSLILSASSLTERGRMK